jgi:hypothetical protein
MFEIQMLNFALLFLKEMKTLGLKPSVKVFWNNDLDWRVT